jgi:N-sulfoglucosamine sulfohydrolase
MKALSATVPAIAARLELFDHRVVEEFYNVRDDPNCLINLIGEPTRREEVGHLRAALESWMERTGDPLLDVFRHRDDPAALAAFMKRVEAEAASRDRTRDRVSDSDAATSGPLAPKAQAKAIAKAQAKANRRDDLIALEVPASVKPGAPAVVKIRHLIPSNLGTQHLHVTLKGGPGQARIERKVVEVSGTGVAEVRFQVPAQVPGGVISFAAFLGEDYPSNLQHRQSSAVPIR